MTQVKVLIESEGLKALNELARHEKRNSSASGNTYSPKSRTPRSTPISIHTSLSEERSHATQC